MELDELDRLAAEAFSGYIVRKDLALRFKGNIRCRLFGEFLLGRYCASTDETEIAEGLKLSSVRCANARCGPAKRTLQVTRP